MVAPEAQKRIEALEFAFEELLDALMPLQPPDTQNRIARIKYDWEKSVDKYRYPDSN